MALQTTISKTSEDLFHDSRLQLREQMRDPVAFHTEMMGNIMYLQQVLRQPDAKEFVLGGPAQNLSNFQMAPIPILSVLTCSTSSPHDILKFLRKIIDHNPPVGWDKRDD